MTVSPTASPAPTIRKSGRLLGCRRRASCWLSSWRLPSHRTVVDSSTAATKSRSVAPQPRVATASTMQHSSLVSPSVLCRSSSDTQRCATGHRLAAITSSLRGPGRGRGQLIMIIGLNNCACRCTQRPPQPPRPPEVARGGVDRPRDRGADQRESTDYAGTAARARFPSRWSLRYEPIALGDWLDLD